MKRPFIPTSLKPSTSSSKAASTCARWRCRGRCWWPSTAGQPSPQTTAGARKVSLVRGTLLTFNIYCLLSPYLRAAAASLLSLKAQGADLEVITSVKRPPGIAEVRCCENQCVNWDEKTACCSGWPWHWYCRPDR